jgi:hypothetical protein
LQLVLGVRMLFIKNRLRKFNNSGYINVALAKSSVGCGSLNQVADSYRCSLRFFYVRVMPILSMMGRSDGAERLAGFYLTSLPTSLRLIAQFGSCSMRFNKLQVEAVIMTTTPNPIVSTQKLSKSYDLTTELEDQQSIMSSVINLFCKNQFVSNTHVNIRG